SKKTGVPVKWVADRTESFMADAHGRDHHTEVEMAFDANNRITALKVDSYGPRSAPCHRAGAEAGHRDPDGDDQHCRAFRAGARTGRHRAGPQGRSDPDLRPAVAAGGVRHGAR